MQHVCCLYYHCIIYIVKHKYISRRHNLCMLYIIMSMLVLFAVQLLLLSKRGSPCTRHVLTANQLGNDTFCGHNLTLFELLAR